MTKQKIMKIKSYVFSGEMACTIILGLFASVILGKTLYDYTREKNVSPKPSSNVVIQEIKASEPTEDYYKEDVLRYIRYKAVKEGLKDKDASLLIRIARAESGCRIDPLAKNSTSTARGAFQIIIGTWESNDCGGKRTNFIDNTDCAIKIYKLRGTQPWETSAHQKSGNGWADPNQCYKFFK